MADSKLSALTAVTTLANSDEVYVNDAGVSKRITATNAGVSLLANAGVTATVAELNILDGATLDVDELNILDGATLSTTELNHVDGVTSAIQTQLNTLTTNNVITKAYASTGQTITSDALLTLAHGLGAEPKLTSFVIQCTSTDAGYNIGDRVEVQLNTSTAASTSFSGVRLDATNIYFRYSIRTGCFNIVDKTGGVVSEIVNSKWQLYVRAYA